MSDKHPFTAEPRKVVGRKVKNLRKIGLIPANIFGSKVKSVSIQFTVKEFLKLYEEVGDTGLIQLTITGEKEPRPVLVHLIQSHPVSDLPIHIDLRQVDLKEKITANVPVELISESPAVAQSGGILVQDLDEVEVEALPTDFPEKFELDISLLKEIGDSLHVSQLKVDTKKLTVQTDPESVVAHVEAPKAEEVVAPAPTPEGEAAPAEGEAPKEGEQATEGTATKEESDKKSE